MLNICNVFFRILGLLKNINMKPDPANFTRENDTDVLYFKNNIT